MMKLTGLLAIAVSSLSLPTLAQNLGGTSNVNLNVNTGDVQRYGAGILLGIPENYEQIPDHWLADIGSWHQRSGGSQLGEPNRGWTHGIDEFNGRYASLLADWQVCKRSDCTFQVMLHDMWGTDSWPSADATPMPGDNGTYADYDNFLDTLLLNMERDGMVGSNVYLDMWNECDNGEFANRGLDRWLEYWSHAATKIRRDFSGKVGFTGPSYGRLPNFAGDHSDWFSEWASLVASNSTYYPDKISMHFLYGDGDLTTSVNSFNGFLNAAGLPNYDDTWNIQEYGSPVQLFPSTCAWNLAQLERHNAWGIRANWLGGLELHDFLANLLGKPSAEPGATYDENDTDYWAAREYPIYLYYNKEMTGYRVQTEMTNNTLSDTYATVDSNERKVRILAGSRPETGTWYINVNSLSSLGLPTSGTLNVNITQFNSAPSIFDRVDAPTALGVTQYNYGGDTAVIAVLQNNPNITWAFDFSY